MATVDKLTVTAARRVQVERFEPVEFAAEIVATLDRDDDPNAVYDALSTEAAAATERAIARYIAAHRYAETGPSLPQLKAVIRDTTDLLDDETITEIAEAVIEAHTG